MRRNFQALMLLVLLASPALLPASSVAADNWAAKMFDATSHDFGTVARGSKAVCSFRLKNIYKESVHIAGVRSSCTCTLPSLDKDTLATYETGEIVAQLDTRSHLGQKAATVTVTFDRPFPAVVQLRVDATIRSDVVFTPGLVQFGSVEQGAIREQHVNVTYAGRSEWEIVDVQSTKDYFEVEMNELSRGGGRVTYDLLVRLKESAPAGYVGDELVLVTNDASGPRIPLAIEGKVNPDLSITPASLYLGDLMRGERITKKVVLRSKTPFKIERLECSNKSFEFSSAKDARTLHVVEVTFVPGEAGKIAQKIQIVTDRATTEFTASGMVSE